MRNVKIGNINIKKLHFGDIIFEIKTTETREINFHLVKSYSYLGVIDWGDGEVTNVDETPCDSSKLITHTYSVNGTYIIHIKPNLWENIDFGVDNNPSYNRINKILSWGNYRNIKMIDFEKSNIYSIPNETKCLNMIKEDIKNSFSGSRIDKNYDWESLSSI